MTYDDAVYEVGASQAHATAASKAIARDGRDDQL